MSMAMFGARDVICTPTRVALVALMTSFVSGCFPSVRGVPDRLYTVQEETDQLRASLPDMMARYYGLSEPQKSGLRNEIIAQRMYIIDVQYSAYEESLTREHQEATFVADTTAIGLNTAGALFTPAATTKVLSGVAGAVTGVKGVYESDVIIAKTVQIIQAQMRANRDAVAARILSRLRESASTYPLSLALTDLESYYRAGTLTAGLIKAADSVGADAQIAQQQKDRVVVISKPSNDDAKQQLLSFMNPNGSPDQDRIRYLKSLLAPGLAVMLGSVVLNDPQQASLRVRLLKCSAVYKTASQCAPGSLANN